jgi:chromosome segregation ATPase
LKVNLDAKNDAIETLKNEQKEIANTLQSKISEQSITIRTLKSDIDQLESTHTLKMIEMEALVVEHKQETRDIELKFQKSREITTQLQGELADLRSSQQIAHEELKATIYLLEKEKGELTDKVAHLAETKVKLGNVEAEHVTLQTEHATLQQTYTEQKQQLSTLEGQMERMTLESNEEKNVSNKLRSQLRELNIQINEDGSARQNEKLTLERELKRVTDILSAIQKEANDMRTRYEADISSHKAELESLRNEHAEQIMLIENSGADVVNDLEDVIDALKKELADGTLEHGKTIHELKSEKERMVRTMSEQQEKIDKLTAYAKERKEEVMVVKKDLERINREREDAVSVVRDELQNAQASHERQVGDLQDTIDSLYSELAVAREQLTNEDEELERAKATLSERTNLLRNMVNQTKSYQGDYERENARANALEEAVAKYKRKSSDALIANQRLEQEIHDKDSQYCDAIRIERHQRKTMEAELDSVRKSMEDMLRKNAEVEKNAEMLRDKVSRQESYIGRLLDREKQSRRTSVMIAARPSTADVRPILPNKHRRKQSSNGTNENDRPNSSREFS